MTPVSIAARLFVTTGTMSTVLDTLERRGFVERSRHPDDRRKVLVHLHPEVQAARVRDARPLPPVADATCSPGCRQPNERRSTSC